MADPRIPPAAAAVADHIAAAVNDAARDPGTDLSPAAAPAVSDSILDRLWPVILNLTNGEPWYRSRVLIGLLVAALGWVLGWVGVDHPDADAVREIAERGLEGVGLVLAAWGRLRPARPPMGGSA